MNKQDIYNYLTENNIEYEAIEHGAVYNMEDIDALDLPHPEAEAKNLFVRDDKKKNYYLITVKGEKRVDLKEFRKKYGLRNLSFASPEDLLSILCLIPGAVTPLGLLNDAEQKVTLYLDADFGDGLIGIHPNDNTATIYMKTPDLIRILKEQGHVVNVVEL